MFHEKLPLPSAGKFGQDCHAFAKILPPRFFKKIILATMTSATLFLSDVLAQNGSICNTPPGISENFCQIEYDPYTEAGPFFVRVFLHVIRDENGEGGQTEAQIEEAMTYLDRAFNPHNIFFVRDCNIEYIDRQDCFEAPGYMNAPGDCIQGHHLSGGVNIYLFPDRVSTDYTDAGYAGGIISNWFALFGKVVPALGPLSMARSFPLAHEMGHCLGLFHTHYGTEEPFLPGTCTNFEECVDGSNASSAGDYVADTPADPNLVQNSTFLVDLPTCQWTNTEQRDECNEDLFNPDEHNIMSYSWPQCYQYFSQGQGERMRHILKNSTTLASFLVQGTQITGSNVVWNLANTPSGVREIDDLLVIKQGAKLTIDNTITVKFTQQGRLIIEPEATLVLKGTLINNSCARFWKGVEVWGNTGELQSSNKHGRFVGQGGHIENAEKGVRLWGPNMTDGAGSIIVANGTTFKNCRIGVEYAPYIKTGANGAILNYSGQIASCTFLTDDDYPHFAPFHSFINMRGVRGVKIIGGSFTNSYLPSGTASYADFGYGIFAHNAGFHLTPQCTTPNTACTGTAFEGLGYGVYLGTDNLQGTTIPHTIKQAEFKKCHVGIQNRSVSGGTMVLNHFEMGEIPGDAPMLFGQLGIALSSNVRGFTLEENIFDKPHTSSFNTFGTFSWDLGEHSNLIRRNTFDNLLVSNMAVLKNADPDPQPPRGLFYECNTSTSTDRYDFFVNGTIQSEQGKANGNAFGPAGNIFSYAGVASDRDFSNSGLVRYHYHDTGTNEEPIDFSGLVKVQEQNQNTCEQKYCAPPCTSEGRQTGTIPYNLHRDTFLLALAAHQTAVQNNDTLTANTKRANAAYHQRRMDDIATASLSAILSDTVSALSSDTLIEWITRQRSIGAHYELAGYYYGRGSLATALDVLDGLPNLFDLTTAEAEDVGLFADLLTNIDGQSVYNLSQATIDDLEVRADGPDGYTKAIAQNILTLYGRDFPPLPDLGEEERPATPEISKVEDVKTPSFRVYPNPVRGQATFEATGPGQGKMLSLRLTNMTGDVVRQSQSTMPKLTIDTQSLPGGIYFYEIRNERNAVSRGKLIIQK